MTSQFPNNAIAEGLAVILHYTTDVAYMGTMFRNFNGFIQRLFSYFKQLPHLSRNITDTKSVGTVTIKTIKKRSTINRDDITILKDDFITRYSVNYYTIH